jgi:hypothetical protein
VIEEEVNSSGGEINEANSYSDGGDTDVIAQTIVDSFSPSRWIPVIFLAVLDKLRVASDNGRDTLGKRLIGRNAPAGTLRQAIGRGDETRSHRHRRPSATIWFQPKAAPRFCPIRTRTSRGPPSETLESPSAFCWCGCSRRQRQQTADRTQQAAGRRQRQQAAGRGSRQQRAEGQDGLALEFHLELYLLCNFACKALE